LVSVRRRAFHARGLFFSPAKAGSRVLAAGLGYRLRGGAAFPAIAPATMKWQFNRGGLLGMGRLLFGVILGLLLAPLALVGWFRYGRPPVGVADTPLPMERKITHVALDARIGREAPATAPLAADEATLVAGAQIYREQCAACHGFHGSPSSFGPHMYPAAPPLWEKHHNGNVVGVSDDPVGETYWKVANGIRLTGMPSYRDVLSDNQIWQVSLLLSVADKPLPPAAVDLLRAQLPAPPPQPGAGGLKPAIH
jgi:mono/diheme cytochrome c family protein